MKFKFKVQDYQTQAVTSVVDVFMGQRKLDQNKYIRDLGKLLKENRQQFAFDEDIYNDLGYKNEELQLTYEELLSNIKQVQSKNDINLSSKIEETAGVPSLDIEMETGTGKTYVYIKTMYELNEKYGWSKFIVVVPSVAIREGVNKSFGDTQDHFMEQYGKKIRYFIYDSNNLTELDNFSSSNDINVMIINMQAFNSEFNEKKKDNKTGAARIIYSRRDEFGTRRPIDVIAANRPVIIMDEPQKMGGDKTQKALKNFNPLFVINYSATHKEQHNLVYVLDALDAYNKKLVKKIEVKGFELKNLTGTNSYIYLDEIILSKGNPRVRLEFEQKNASGSIRKNRKILDHGDSLYIESNELSQYEGYTISDINGSEGFVEFTNGIKIFTGQATGDVTDRDKRRIQIRETIDSHFQKEEKLFYKGIKTLSLFFIDEVAKYRQYDEDDNEVLGEYGKIFEEEYKNKLNEVRTLENKDSEYLRYLDSFEVAEVHNGYFSIDKKGKLIDSKIKRGEDFSDDITAYDLILKNKERLLSFEEPTRFIFSHSALREGWDNPNVFQICTLKHSDSNVTKRQEVGRGLRIAVNKDGNRQDKDVLDNQFHDINLLTVIASESYKTFVDDLQSDIKRTLYERPTKVSKDYYVDKYVVVDDKEFTINEEQANYIDYYMKQNSYVDYNGKLTEKYKEDLSNNKLVPFVDEFKEVESAAHRLNQAIYDDSVLDSMISNANDTKIYENPLNENFRKKEFQELWSRINYKYAYKVEFSSEELIQKSIDAINKDLMVTKLRYSLTTGSQEDEITAEKLNKKDSFKESKKTTKELKLNSVTSIKYDLIGKIAADTTLTRLTVGKILGSIEPKKFVLYRANPEQFIINVSKIINEQKASTTVEHVAYNKLNERFDTNIFTNETTTKKLSEAYKSNKSIQDYVFTDGYAINTKSVERQFAEDLDNSDDVVVYAKLPKGFKIPTPVGNYSPDWAISFKEGSVKHLYFVAETKGTMESMQLRPIEQAKIKCAEKLFNEISTENVRYKAVDNFDSLLDVMESIK